jgi:hypothetical protein
MIGNFVTGIGLLGPTAMLGELSAGLGVTIREASSPSALRCCASARR